MQDGVPYIVGDGDDIHKSEGAFGWLRLIAVATRRR